MRTTAGAAERKVFGLHGFLVMRQGRTRSVTAALLMLAASALAGCGSSATTGDIEGEPRPLDVIGCVERDGSGVLTLRVVDTADTPTDTQPASDAVATDSAGGTAPRVQTRLVGTTTTAGANWAGSRALQIDGMDLSHLAGQRVHAVGSLAPAPPVAQRVDQLLAAHGVPYRRFTVSEANPVGGICPAPVNATRSAEPPT